MTSSACTRRDTTTKAAQGTRRPLGQSRLGGPVIDLPKGSSRRRTSSFVTQLDLAWLAPSVNGRCWLPEDHGFLFFFYNLFVEQNGVRQVALVHYFSGTARQLRRVVREHSGWFWRGMSLVGWCDGVEFMKDRYRPDGRWDYFAGMKQSKIGGYPSNPQWQVEDVEQSLAGDGRLLLLQVGEDVTGGGCLCYFIEEADHFQRRFDHCEAVWGQT